MIGWWVPAARCGPTATTSSPRRYVKPGRALVALASWARDPVDVRLAIDWHALGIDPARATITAPAIAGFQPAARSRPADRIPVAPGKGWLLVLDAR